MMSALAANADSMDRIYRYQRHIYDASRRYYLLGRLDMLNGMMPPQGGTILEVGCGTAWNLIRAADRYPTALCYGFDISSAMLQTARKRVSASGLERRIVLSHGDAETFDPVAMFDRPQFDRVFISYALSMIPNWRQTIERSIRALAPGGSLHIVDFGTCQSWPRPAKAVLYAWLRRFEVTPRSDLEEVLRACAGVNALKFRCTHMKGGYAIYAVIGPETSITN